MKKNEKKPKKEPKESSPEKQGFILLQQMAGFTLAVVLAEWAAFVTRNTVSVSEISRYSGWSLLASFAVATLLILLMIKTARGTKLVGAVFALALFMGIGSLSSIVLGDAVAVILMALAIIAYYSSPPVILHNLIVIVGISGVAAVVGPGFNPTAALVIMAILAFYDIFSVYGSKHMVVMGKALIEQKQFFGLVLPAKARGLRIRIRDVSPGRRFHFLGTGDVVLPVLLVASVAVRESFSGSLLVALGAALGLFMTHTIFFSQRQHKPMAALPPIALGSAIGYVVSRLIL